jgi:hypothetical protein
MCLDYIDRRVEELGKQYPGSTVDYFSEGKVNPGAMAGRDDWWGTVDITIVVELNGKIVFIEIIDYKDGRMYVDANVNTQLLSYLFGTLHDTVGEEWSEVDACRITIVQPKNKTPVRYHSMDHIYAMSKFIEMKEAAQRTDDPNAILSSGSWCQWCKHKQNCTADTEQSMRSLTSMENLPVEGNPFSVVGEGIGDVSLMNSEQLVIIADAEKGIVSAFKRVKEEIQRRIESGQSVIGYAMLPGRSSRVWNKTEEEMLKILKGRRLKQSEIYPATMITPAAVEKLDDKLLTKTQKKSLIDHHVTTMAGKSTLKAVEQQVQTKDANEVFKDVAEEPTPAPPSFF